MTRFNEELDEYQADKSVGELADLLEIIYAVANARGYSTEELENIRSEKAAQRGRLKKKFLLKQVIKK